MKDEKQKTLLIFPPQWIPLNPHFSLATLAGHLKGEGHEVVLEDINIKFYRHILSPEYMDYSAAKAENSYQFLKQKLMITLASNDDSLAAQIDSARLLKIEKNPGRREQMIQKVKEELPLAFSVFDSREKFYDPFLLVKAFLTVDKALEIASLPYYPAKIRFNDFFTPRFPLTVQGIIDFTNDADENMFLPFMKREATRLLKYQADIIGISINSPTQLLPGLTLSRILMQKKPEGCHLNIGGNYFTKLREVILSRKELFDLFTDSIILGEGQKPLLKLIAALKGGESLKGVPSLIYADPELGRPVYTSRDMPVPLNDLHHQVLDDLPLDRYFVPDLAISLQSSKGCYWQKCTFCDTDFGVEPDIKDVDRLIDEIRFLNTSYGIRHFEFIDESITPQYMDAMARRIIKEKLDITWFCNARTERAFTRRRLDLYRKSGLVMLLWGVESGSARIMKLINKGVDFEKRLEILKSSSDSGIWNFAYIFFGLPTETREEAEMTIDLIRDHTDIIHSYGRSVFTLGRHAALKDKAEKLGLVECIMDEQELSTSMGYRSLTGMTPREVMEMADICKAACHLQYGEPLWMYLKYREILFLYISRYGMDFVLNHKFTDEQKRTIHSMYGS
ncbi:MAG: radical SAM protein [Candidatus Eremiobacteraeota bacterium]|nr:radical SAM protein [Candidatus Eremiobacteraeota bacterium]